MKVKLEKTSNSMAVYHMLNVHGPKNICYHTEIKTTK